MRYILLVVTVSMILLMSMSASAVSVPPCDKTDAFCFSSTAHQSTDSILQVKTPEVAVPLWYAAGTTE